MLFTSSLQYKYRESQSSIEFPKLSCISGGSLLISGPSGSGKTTWLHMISGLLRPTTGTIRILDQEITQFSPKEMDAFRSNHIGMVLQRAHFISSLNVLENLLLFQNLSNKGTDRNYIAYVMDSLDLSGLEKRKVSSLSQGEAQRLGLARAIINRPKLLLADEPSSSLDDRRAEAVMNLLLEQSNSLGSSLIVVSHDSRIKSCFKQQIQLT